MRVEIPLRTVSGLNVREHWSKRAKRVRWERIATRFVLGGEKKPRLPCAVTLTRVGPSNGLDPFDNLPSSMKGVADEVALWLGVDDRKSDLVRYECQQERGPKWLVRIEVRDAV